MSAQPSSTSIPSAVQTILDLFASELGDVRFGDVDAPLLGRLAADVEAAASVVASAQAALDGARVTLLDRQESLLQQAQRALAYARVYAEADEALGTRLDAIALPRATRRVRGPVDPTGSEVLVLTADPPVATRPRGRPRKVLGPPPTSVPGAAEDAPAATTFTSHASAAEHEPFDAHGASAK